jgi:hypothetical protein
MKHWREAFLIIMSAVFLTSIWSLAFHLFGWNGVLALGAISLLLSIITTL